MTSLDLASSFDIDSEEYRTWKNLHIQEICSNEIAVIDKDDDWKAKYLKSQVSFVNHANSLVYLEQQRKLRIQIISMEASLLEEREYSQLPAVEKVDTATSPIKEISQSPRDTFERQQSREHESQLEYNIAEVEEGSGIKLFENQVVTTVNKLPSKEDCDDASTHGLSIESIDDAPNQILDVAQSTINIPDTIPEPVSIWTRSYKSRTMKVLSLECEQDDNTQESQHCSTKSLRRRKAVHDQTMNDKENEENADPTLQKKSKSKRGNVKTEKVTTRRKKTQVSDPDIDIFFDRSHDINTNVEGLNHFTKDISPIKPSNEEEQSITDTSGSSMLLDCSLDGQDKKQRQEFMKNSKRKQNILATFQVPVLKKKIRERK